MGNYCTELSYANSGGPGAVPVFWPVFADPPGSRGVPWVRVGTPHGPGGSSRYPSVTSLCVCASLSAIADPIALSVFTSIQCNSSVGFRGLWTRGALLDLGWTGTRGGEEGEDHHGSDHDAEVGIRFAASDSAAGPL